MVQTPLLLVLHAVRLRTVASIEVVAARSSVDPLTVERVLDEAVERGWVQRREGALAGWTLTSAGRSEGERLLADELSTSGARSMIVGSYSRFRSLNGELLSICTDWQVMTRDGVEVVNDHLDASRDAQVLQRLDLLHVAIQPVVDQLGAGLERFGGYGRRLGAAHERIKSGETEWLTRPTIDSYHTVWFELHEDLLATLGRRRIDERLG